MGDIIDLYEMVKDLQERIEVLEEKALDEQEQENIIEEENEDLI